MNPFGERELITLTKCILIIFILIKIIYPINVYSTNTIPSIDEVLFEQYLPQLFIVF